MKMRTDLATAGAFAIVTGFFISTPVFSAGTDVTIETGVFVPNMPTQAAGDPVCIDSTTKQLVKSCDAAASGGGLYSVVLDSDATEVGKLVGVNGYNYWVTINTNGFLLHLNTQGMPRPEQLYFSGTDCTGDAFFTGSDDDMVSLEMGTAMRNHPDDSPPVTEKIYMAIPGTAGVADAPYNSIGYANGCSNSTGTRPFGIPLTLNVEATSGIPDSGYGPVSLMAN